MWNDLPHDVVSVIVDRMDVRTFCTFRFVSRIPWTVRMIREYAQEALMIRERECVGYRNTFTGLKFQMRTRLRCAHCTNHAMWFVDWGDGLSRRFIP